MSSALARKSWSDLTRRPGRTVLTTLTLALAVASFGILALPSLMNRAMTSAVATSRLYNLFVPIDETALSSAQLARLSRLPNVTSVSARTIFATRTLIGGRRVDTEVWGVPNFSHQPVDQVVTADRPGMNQVLVDGQDATFGISNAKAGDTLRVQGANGSFESVGVVGSAAGMAFNQNTQTGQLVLYATQQTVQRLGALSGVNLLEFRLRDAQRPAAQRTEASVRTFLATQPAPTTFSAIPTIRTPGDWPAKSIFNERSRILDVLILLAVVSATFLLVNTIRTMVAEQRREIGVMRAIGASGRGIRFSYLRTAALLGTAGAAIGALLGIGISFVLVALFARLIFGVSPSFAVDWAVVMLSVVVGLGGTLLIAWPTLGRALRTPVHEALTSEGLVSQFGTGRLDRAIMHSRLLPTPVRIGARNVARQKGRAITTVVQVALAVATLLGLLSLALAVTQVTNQSWNVLDYDITLSAQPGGHWFSPTAIRQLGHQAGVAGVEAADWSQMAYQGQTLYGLGVHADTFVREPLAIGHWLTVDEERAAAPVAVVGSAIARRWNLQVGSHVTFTTAGGPQAFQVIGVGASDANNGFNVYTSLAFLSRVIDRPGVANAVFVRSTNHGHPSVNALAVRLEDRLASAGFATRSQLMYVGRATDQATAHTTLVIVESIGLLIVAISMLGLINMITMSIIERTREIGVLRSLGARARDLRRIFRTETLVLALSGFVVAIPLGWVVAHAVQWLMLHVANAQLPAPYTLENLIVAFVGTLVLAVLVVVLPLRRATRLRPGDAIRYN